MKSVQADESLMPGAPQLPVDWNRRGLHDMNSVTPLSIQSVLPSRKKFDARKALLPPSVVSLIIGQVISAFLMRVVSSAFIASTGSMGSSRNLPSGGVTRVALRMHAASGSGWGQPRPSPTNGSGGRFGSPSPQRSPVGASMLMAGASSPHT